MNSTLKAALTVVARPPACRGGRRPAEVEFVSRLRVDRGPAVLVARSGKASVDAGSDHHSVLDQSPRAWHVQLRRARGWGRVPAKPTPANERAPGHYRFASNCGVVVGRRSASVPERNRKVRVCEP